MSDIGHRANSPLVILGRTLPVTRLVAVIYVIITLYALAFWIQTGVNPWLTKKLGVDSTVYGYLQTTFAVLQLCGSDPDLNDVTCWCVMSQLVCCRRDLSAALLKSAQTSSILSFLSLFVPKSSFLSDSISAISVV